MPPLSWNEIKTRALAFSRHWADEYSEDAEAKTFWNEFFEVFGLNRRRVASFEQRVKTVDGRSGYIDLLWKGILLVEHKSRGKDLDRAHQQALGYFSGLKERDLPRYILVSDFARFRLYDLEEDSQHEFPLSDLYRQVHRFGFIAGYQTHKPQEQDPVNIKAAERMGRLHDQMKETGYSGHALEVYLVRLLFCLFAEDTGIFQPRQFQDYIEQRTREDGSDTGSQLASFFQILNSPEDCRLKHLDETLAAFPFINGKLFQETLPIAAFDSLMRQRLLDCCGIDWSRISPAIFGSLFQSIMDKKARRNLGAHYTSEQNILKLIQPLFLDDLRKELDKITERKTGRNKELAAFHDRLRKLTFFDPACGCGNFLVIAYRELRLLELDLLRLLHTDVLQHVDIQSLIRLNVDQFFGIEIEEFPAQIAQVALWLTDHQMNQRISEEFGLYFARIPLKTSANIVCGNALRLDWNEVIPAKQLHYIMGNPPFVGHQWRDAEQVADMNAIWGKEGRFGRLDYVACWHKKAVSMMRENDSIAAAFVSTNSISQGEQVGILWPELMSAQVKINFAHRTFQWNSEARGKAAVHCVIIGFSLRDQPEKWLFEYETPSSEPQARKVSQLNPYLIDAANIVLPSRSGPFPGIPPMKKGSQPTDGGNLIMTQEEKEEFLRLEPEGNCYLRPYVGGEDFISGRRRWCLWLKDADPGRLRQLDHVMNRVKAVKEFRLKSPTASVREFANQPTLFTQDRQPDFPYLALSEVSSENRRYIPIGFMEPDIIASNTLQIVVGATLYCFGVMNSVMHMAWVHTVCGRLESRIRYTPSVYNNFPWPENPSVKQQQAVEAAAQAVLDARAQFPESSLADLYDPLTMPPVLLKAHQALDRAVDTAYGRSRFKSEAERVAFLFDLYQSYINSLPLHQKKKTARKGSSKIL
jgi:type I restriction-modification system DNA methylase subunit